MVMNKVEGTMNYHNNDYKMPVKNEEMSLNWKIQDLQVPPVLLWSLKGEGPSKSKMYFK